ncbi:hypothetical protein CIK92_02880 [Prevotella sp. P4-67]|uniref:hypothetical protein n=1 Tax=Prevotella sp. P4-67 TaxID=2024227 RepID=UPI000B95DBD6|nr:hypothetical protein [Prevotella sp. P4-67]OYP75645.1 hypothetical protein CIK92_02880 [Prevotella sp. P4-67]
MVAAVGFALVWLAVPTVGKRVFLLVVSAIPTVMHGMTPSVVTVKKAAFGRSKSPAFAGTKNSCLLDASLRLSLGDFCFPLSMRIGRCGCRCRPMWMSLSTDVDVVVGRRAALWGITALLTDWTTDMMHVMLFSAITCSAVGVAARLQTAIPTLAIIIAGSYHLIRGLVPIVT